VEVISLTLEEVVGFDLDDDVEVTGRATFSSVISIAAGAEAGTVLDTSGDFDADFGALFGATAA
jgi:hypothetical protein